MDESNVSMEKSDKDPIEVQVLNTGEVQTTGDINNGVLAKENNGVNESTSTTNPPSSPKPRPPRNKPLTSSIVSQSEITKEFLERVEKKRHHCPDGVDVCLAMTSPSQLRLPKIESSPSVPSTPKLTKVRDANKASLDASELLAILEGGAETHYVEKPKPKIRTRGPRDLKIDPDLEKSLAMKQLMEFTQKKGRPKRDPENNNNVSSSSKPKKKEVKRGKRGELQKLLQDEGAINMLYSVEKGEPETKDRLLSSKRRQKKVLLKRAQEVEEALLGGTSNKGVMLRHRTAEKRKPSVDSVDSEHSGKDFAFTSPAEASKIIRRHSSSSSYSSRGSSPQRSCIELDRSPVRNYSDFNSSLPSTPQKDDSHPKTSSPIKMSERAEKLIELKCKEYNLQPEHSKMIKQIVQEKKNGLKERLQSEFKTKFKAAITATPVKQVNYKEYIVSSSPSPVKTNNESKPIWKTVVEDWETMDDNDLDPDDPHQSSQSSTTNQIASAKNSSKVKIEAKQHITKGVPRPLDSIIRRCKELSVEKVDKVIRFNISPTSTFLPQALNAKVLSELCQALDHADQCNDIRVIVLTSTGSVFCNGVDLPSLIAEDRDKRRLVAAETAIALKDFVCKLSMVGKPVLVGVSGQTVGLGVVLLTYCDYVLADETSTFLTPYPKLGCLPEGAATLVLPYVIGHRMASSLLLGSTRLTSVEAEQCGLVTKVIPKHDLISTLMQDAQNMSRQSPKSMESTKALLMHNLRTRLPNVLNTEVRLLEQTWSSDECQARIKQLEIHPIF
ncbi:hypothetical protein O3M35_011676 [Rhynocoris fuscipes]|uniref:Uncharacterized protein n=1 Tax=Rhynocoris fuscipes TaxID=488301 RepID=A0AAW1CZR8_9HEMI